VVETTCESHEKTSIGNSKRATGTLAEGPSLAVLSRRIIFLEFRSGKTQNPGKLPFRKTYSPGKIYLRSDV
jgi:hypothetical protein